MVWKPGPIQIRRRGDPLPAQSSDEWREIAQEYQELRDARIGILDAWNWLENEMVQLLRTCVGTPDPIVASILYFSPHSFPTRVDIVTKLIAHLIETGQRDKKIIADWQKIADKLKRKKDARNHAAHGHIVTYSGQRGRNQAVLAPVMM